ncbi:MAG: hypothetical protein E7378_01310 [Clostridiales bacterium]|nr:hypothetical protein [Clostridiales bacterium]
MTNKDFLQNMGVRLSGDVKRDNAMLNAFFNIESQEDIVVTVQAPNGKSRQICLSTNNFRHAFANVVWSKLDLSQKLRVLKWLEVDYMLQNGYSNDKIIPTFEFFAHNMTDDIAYSAITRDSGIELNLEQISSASGYNLAVIIAHECVHAIDHVFSHQLRKKYDAEYFLPADMWDSNVSIITLPIRGKVWNRKFKRFDEITPQMREDFLFLKNIISSITPQKETPSKRRLVGSEKSFKKYVQNCFYRTLPLEQRAFVTSCEFGLYLADFNTQDFPPDEVDQKAIIGFNDTMHLVQGKKREIEKYFDMPYQDALNMELIAKFNKTYFKSQEYRYICKDLMQERKKCYARLWDTKFAHIEGFKNLDERGL